MSKFVYTLTSFIVSLVYIDDLLYRYIYAFVKLNEKNFLIIIINK